MCASNKFLKHFIGYLLNFVSAGSFCVKMYYLLFSNSNSSFVFLVNIILQRCSLSELVGLLLRILSLDETLLLLAKGAHFALVPFVFCKTQNVVTQINSSCKVSPTNSLRDIKE